VDKQLQQHLTEELMQQQTAQCPSMLRQQTLLLALRYIALMSHSGPSEATTAPLASVRGPYCPQQTAPNGPGRYYTRR